MLLPGFDADCRRKEGVGPFYGSVEVGSSREEVGGSREARMVVVTVRRIWLVLSEKKKQHTSAVIWCTCLSSRLVSFPSVSLPHPMLVFVSICYYVNNC